MPYTKYSVRHRIHHLAIRRVLEKLRRMGLEAQETLDHQRGNLITRGTRDVFIAVRAANERTQIHRTTSKAGKPYVYRYRVRTFCLHERGEVRQSPDFWVFVSADGPGSIVVPHEIAKRRKTLHEHHTDHARGNWFDEWKDNWGQVAAAAGAGRKAA